MMRYLVDAYYRGTRDERRKILRAKVWTLRLFRDSMRRSGVTPGRYARSGSAGRMSVFIRCFLVIQLVFVFVLMAVASSRAKTITAFQADGDCFDLASRYLRERGVAYIVSDDIRGMECHWNFHGNTQADFDAWCKRKALTCGGNPFYVGFDSTWYAGERMPAQRAKYLREQELKQQVKDSLSVIVRTSEPLAEKTITIEYLEIGKSTADKIGFDYSEYIGSARFFDYTDLFSVSIQAKAHGDTSFVYRTYTTQYDTTLHVFWGGVRDKIKHSTVTSSGIVSNDYETETYGLTFDVQDMRYTYTHSMDFEHKIDGTGKLRWGKNKIFGSYDYTAQTTSGIPFFKDLPLVGVLFRHVTASR